MFQKELSSQIDVDVSLLCKIEMNEKKLSLEKLELVSSILNLDFLKYKMNIIMIRLIQF